LLLGTRPSLDLLLERDGAFTGFKLALPCQQDRLAAGGMANEAIVMLLQAHVDVVRLPAVIRAVGAFEQVDEERLHGQRRQVSPELS
jgi:hypothetical protein